LAAQGINAAANEQRNWDHGCFVPLLLSHPKAEIPVVQLSLIQGLDPAAHINLGRALSSLRNEGVLILGSGLSFHNMQAFFHPTAAAKQHSEAFDTWLQACLCSENTSVQRTAQLINWQQAPSARFCHPREEHLLPLFVCFGAALGARAQVSFEDYLMGVKVSAFSWD
jgi:aromatic ring-opening dioxygenase catalytic subunit (LigB family)